MVCEIGGSSRELGNNGAVRNDLGRLSLCAVSVTLSLTLTDDAFDCFSGVVCVSPTATLPPAPETPRTLTLFEYDNTIIIPLPSPSPAMIPETTSLW